MKILVIEDEPKAREYMRSGLTESGYVVDVAVNGLDGLFMAQEHHYDLILLDVMMPRLNGWEVMAQLDEKFDTPVIFLTAKGTVEDKIKGLELGADDYLVKPFSFAELLARIRTTLRRGGQAKREEQLTVGELYLNTTTRRAAGPDEQRVQPTTALHAQLRPGINPNPDSFAGLGHEF